MSHTTAASTVIARAIACGLWLIVPAIAGAQSDVAGTRQARIEQEKQAKAAQLAPTVRQRGDTIVARAESLLDPLTPGVKLSFGGFRPGAGLGPGVAYTNRAGALGRWTIKGAWSTRDFKLVDGRLDLAELASGRLAIQGVAHWEDSPELHFFGIGPDSAERSESSYALRTTEAGASARLRALPQTFVGGGMSYVDIASNNRIGSFPPIDHVFTATTTPGLGSSATWIHSTAFVAYDWRQAEGYTRRGGLYRVAYHDYRSLHGDPFTFGRVDVDARQFIPLVHENWIVALQARAQLTTSDSDRTIPYYMLPYLGGGDSLRGYDQYRFIDRQSVLLRTELRWTPSSILDMAVFLDQGTVASERRLLDLGKLKRGWGIGGRFHGANGTGLRLEVAHGDEGWRLHFAQTASF